MQGDRFRGRARTAEGEEQAELWRRMAEIWPHYDTYATRTDREIPVVVVERLTLSATFLRKAGRQTPNRGHPISVTITW